MNNFLILIIIIFLGCSPSTIKHQKSQYKITVYERIPGDTLKIKASDLGSGEKPIFISQNKDSVFIIATLLDYNEFLWLQLFISNDGVTDFNFNTDRILLYTKEGKVLKSIKPHELANLYSKRGKMKFEYKEKQLFELDSMTIRDFSDIHNNSKMSSCVLEVPEFSDSKIKNRWMARYIYGTALVQRNNITKKASILGSVFFEPIKSDESLKLFCMGQDYTIDLCKVTATVR